MFVEGEVAGGVVESGEVAGPEPGGGLGGFVGAGVGSGVGLDVLTGCGFWLFAGVREEEGAGAGLGAGVGEGLGAGERVSTVRETELLASAPSLLRLPAASENLEEATEMTPSAVLSAVGVKVAE